MLTNTVGIMLFILAFTLLTTSGATLPKRLPMEHPTDSQPIDFFCFHDRVLPLNNDLIDKFNKLDSLADGAEVEDEFFKLHVTIKQVTTTSGDNLRALAEFLPKPGAGYTLAQLKDPHGPFAQILAQNDPKTKFLFFHVTPGGMNIFFQARTIGALNEYHTAWEGYGEDEKMSINLNGGSGGGGHTPQPQ